MFKSLSYVEHKKNKKEKKYKYVFQQKFREPREMKLVLS